MSSYVLDSFALLAHIREETSWKQVEALLEGAKSGDTQLFMCVVNMVEVQYRILRENFHVGRLLASIDALPVQLHSADELVPAVTMIKALYPVSLADCFATALALKLDCPVVTGDPEFKKLEELISVEWLS